MRLKIAVLALILILCGGATLSILKASAFDARAVAAGFAAQCAKEKTHEVCYESLVPQLYPQHGVAQLFDVVRALRAQDPSYQFCHVLGHKIGERVVAEDPTRWLDDLAYNPPDSLCSNGYLHGVVGGRFRSEVLDVATIEKLIPDFSLACKPHAGWQPTPFDQAVCEHGMGHLYDFITDANLPQALDLCRRTLPKDAQRVCIQGVFMQIYQPLEPDDYQLIARMKTKPTKTTVRQFCATFKDPEYIGSCREESWPLFREELLRGIGVQAYCSGYPNAQEEEYCWRGISAIIGRLSLGDATEAQHACDNFPVAWQGMCYEGSAQAIVEESRSAAAEAVSFCARAQGSVAQECYSGLARDARQLFGDAQGRGGFCRLLPAQYQPSC